MVVCFVRSSVHAPPPTLLSPSLIKKANKPSSKFHNLESKTLSIEISKLAILMAHKQTTTLASILEHSSDKYSTIATFLTVSPYSHLRVFFSQREYQDELEIQLFHCKMAHRKE